MRFKGKVAWWFYGVIIAVAAVLIPLIIVSAFVDPNRAALVITLLLFCILEPFCCSIALHNYVELQEEAALIVFGFIKKRILYSDIEALSLTNDPSSSLAASLDRVEIKCRNGSAVMVSVADREGFVREMQRRKN